MDLTQPAVPSAARRPPSATAVPTRVRVRRIGPWSVLTTALILSTLLAMAMTGAALGLYLLLDSAGVVSAVNDLYNTLIDPATGDGPAPAGPVTLTVVAAVCGLMSAVAVLGAVTLAAVSAVLYNLTARVSGGVSVTLRG